MTAPFVFLDSGDRAATVAGLRALADFLETHPEVPAPGRHDTSIMLFTRCNTDTDEQACRAEVDRVAAALGVTPVSRGNYVAARDFGPISYQVVHIPAAAQRAHAARQSYVDVVQYDSDSVAAGAGVPG